MALGRDPAILDVHYERLVSHFEPTCRSIMGFLEENLDQRQLNPAFYSRTRVAESRGHERLKEPVGDSSVERWKRELSEEDARNLWRYAGVWMRELGYAERSLEGQVSRGERLQQH
jgi:hypothetical protein